MLEWTRQPDSQGYPNGPSMISRNSSTNPTGGANLPNNFIIITIEKTRQLIQD